MFVRVCVSVGYRACVCGDFEKLFLKPRCFVFVESGGCFQSVDSYELSSDFSWQCSKLPLALFPELIHEPRGYSHLAFVIF